jgi:hypothetical protein
MQVWPTGFALEEPLLLDATVWGHGEFVPAFTREGSRRRPAPDAAAFAPAGVAGLLESAGS